MVDRWELPGWVTAPEVPDEFLDLWDDYERRMRLLKRSGRTAEMHRSALNRLVSHVYGLRGEGDPRKYTQKDIEGWVEHMQLDGVDEMSINIYIRTARPIFSWLYQKDRTGSPFYEASLPPAPDRPVPIEDIESINKIVDSCADVCAVPIGRSVEWWRKLLAARDEALVRGFFDMGNRRGEMRHMLVSDWLPHVDLVHISHSKTYARDLVIGDRTALSWKKYLRKRQQVMDRLGLEHDYFWISRRGNPMTDSGIYRAIARVSKSALGRPVNPQRLRHLAAHLFLLNGGEEGDLVRKHGWKGRSMVDHYARSTANARSQEAQRRLAIGDKLK